jgi:PKD repeat protein
VLFSGPGVLKANTTDANGTYTTPTPIPNGTYNVTASAKGFTSLTKSVVVNGASVGAIDFALSPSAVNQTLSVAASATPGSGHAPLAVRFLARITGGVAPYNETWHFGDGSPTAGGAAPTHRYNSSGTFSAVVQVADSAGAVATAATNVTVLPAPNLTAGAAVRGTACNSTGYSAVLVATATGGAPPYNATWSFGDGATATGATVTHLYAQRTGYTATATVTDSAHKSAVAKVSVSPPAGCGGTGGLGGGLVHTLVGWVRTHVLLTAIIVAAVAVLIGAGLAVRARRRAPVTVVSPPPSP